MVLGAHAQSPRAQQALARCAPFEQRCGALYAGDGKTVLCAYVALLGDALSNALASCFSLACGLGQECIASTFMRALMPCDLPDR
jgi:hypothetical protein